MSNNVSQTYDSNVQQDVVILLDITIYPDLAAQRLVREVINRIQKLRKKAGLEITDEVIMEYSPTTNTDILESAVNRHEDMFVKTLRAPLQPFSTENDKRKVLISELQELQDVSFTLRLLEISRE